MPKAPLSITVDEVRLLVAGGHVLLRAEDSELMGLVASDTEDSIGIALTAEDAAALGAKLLLFAEIMRHERRFTS